MVRKLKHHEQKLLKKVDFNTYKSDNDHREAAVIRRYGIQQRDDCMVPVIALSATDNIRPEIQPALRQHETISAPTRQFRPV
jgi:ribosomal protein S4